MIPSRPAQGLWALLIASPYLLPLSQAPIVTAVPELWSVAVAGALCLLVAVWLWTDAPLRWPGAPAHETAPSDLSLRTWLLERILIGLYLAAVGSAVIGVLQVFAPAGITSHGAGWVEPSHLSGRAVGHLRQPNLLATLLVWGGIVGAVLWDRRRLSDPAAAGLQCLLVLGVVLSGSRTGLLGLLLMALWGLTDRRLRPVVRGSLGLSPVLGLLVTLALPRLLAMVGTEAAGETVAAATALTRSSGSGDLSSSRFAIWRDTWTLIQAHPWTGVGWGQFNIAWTLTPLPDRPTALFDHAHNLPLHLMAELGIPGGLALFLALLAWIGVAFRRAWRAVDNRGVWARGASGLLLMGLLHSQLEYPWWYATFLLPSAALLVLLTLPGQGPARGQRWGAVLAGALGAAAVLGSVWAYADYRVIHAIYAPGPGAASLADRMARGQTRTWFAAQAHYAVATQTPTFPGQAWPDALERALAEAPRVLLDARLMMAWADALRHRDAPGDAERAQYLAARLAEFHPPAARRWLERCAGEDGCRQFDSVLRWSDLWPVVRPTSPPHPTSRPTATR